MAVLNEPSVTDQTSITPHLKIEPRLRAIMQQEHLKRLPDFDDVEAERRALDHAEYCKCLSGTY